MGKKIKTAAPAAAMGGSPFDRRLPERSRLDLIAIEESPITGRWRPGSSLLLILVGSAILWLGVLAFCFALLR